jgi:hypothetical protein
VWDAVSSRRGCGKRRIFGHCRGWRRGEIDPATDPNPTICLLVVGFDRPSRLAAGPPITVNAGSFTVSDRSCRPNTPFLSIYFIF